MPDWFNLKKVSVYKPKLYHTQTHMTFKERLTWETTLPAKNIMSSQLNLIHFSKVDRNKTTSQCFSLHLIYFLSGFSWMAASLAQQSGHDGPLRGFTCLWGEIKTLFNAEMLEQQSVWENGGGRATISSMWLPSADHIFRQKNPAGLLTSISVGDMYIETMVGILPTMETEI